MMEVFSATCLSERGVIQRVLFNVSEQGSNIPDSSKFLVIILVGIPCLTFGIHSFCYVPALGRAPSWVSQAGVSPMELALGAEAAVLSGGSCGHGAGVGQSSVKVRGRTSSQSKTSGRLE